MPYTLLVPLGSLRRSACIALNTVSVHVHRDVLQAGLARLCAGALPRGNGAAW